MRYGIFAMITLLLISIALPIVDAQLHDTLVKDQPKLPKGLSDFYDNYRKEYMPEFIRFALGGSMMGGKIEENTKDFFSIGNYIVIHDVGGLDARTSRIAEEYLEDTVIKPLKEKKSVPLQTGNTMSFKKLDRLSLAKLLYYYVRDDVYFPHGEEGGRVSPLSRIPGMNLMFTTTPEIIRFPCETVEDQHGACADQALLLATLLNMEGYEVALGTAPSMAKKNKDGTFTWFGYHVCVYLKDEGWRIGRYDLGKDVFGNDLGGKWIILDPINSPRHVSHMRMMGGGKVLEFGDDPNWVEYREEDNTLFGYGLIDEETAKRFDAEEVKKRLIGN
ncbi:MAG: transglutaminase domain-containing protein [Candidatus Methanolliviera hydrocarbonicum]|uniref:Transglutaminase domain-containing protein n=1 Tax=Candidatus Methanolliviera hydrocarbonicum TaxID=2491085 RepID=A0A520KVH7_9EURY|nr:MAG: transglutaminase domain-containing protein [Candidatus Methanolliviera hydrocarbonicum]